MRKIELTLIAVLASTLVLTALACGPDFKLLLPSRAHVLADPATGGNFSADAMHLLDDTDATENLPPITATNEVNSSENPTTSDEQPNPQVEKILDASGDETYRKLADKPEADRLYAAAATDFHLQHYIPAAERFRKILTLPDKSGDSRVIWAAFMLGRIALVQIRDGNPDPQLLLQADKYFAMTRTLASQGKDDPRQLALESYGEQARAHLLSANYPDLADGSSKEVAENVVQAVHLYAMQSRLGGDGIISLRDVSRWLFSNQDLLSLTADDDVTRKLMISYVVDFVEPGDVLGSNAAIPEQADKMRVLLKISEQQFNHKNFDGADNLAVMAYAMGRYEDAAKFAKHANSPRGEWLKAKLAIQRGDMDAAARQYHQALTAYAQEHPQVVGTTKPTSLEYTYAEDYDWTTVPPEALLRDEFAVFSVGRGDFDQALQILSKTSWLDAAYLAERIFSTEELRAYVDQHAASIPVLSDEEKKQGVIAYRHTPAEELRELLARRLMREGEFAQAIPYFYGGSMAQDESGKPVSGNPAQWANGYVASLSLAKHTQNKLEEAQAWYAAASMAHEHGMEILGYELDPDDAFGDGNFQLNSNFAPKDGLVFYAGDSKVNINALPKDSPLFPRANAEQKRYREFNLISSSERQRFASTTPTINKRFHYRYIAAQEARQAAALLPVKSQAYASVLCNATSWILSGDGKLAQSLYHQYVKHGAQFAWATHFGHKCPEPDFTALQTGRS
jgi:cellulose synthase operon protein C